MLLNNPPGWVNSGRNNCGPVSEMSLHQLPHVATSQLSRKFVDSYGSSCSAWDMVNCAANYRPDQAGGLLNSKTGVNSWGFVGFRRI